MVEKTRAFIGADGAEHVLIVCPHEQRADQVREWIWREWGRLRQEQLTVLTLAEIRDDPTTFAHLAPADPIRHYDMPALRDIRPQPRP